jgi:hypothetical protein
MLTEAWESHCSAIVKYVYPHPFFCFGSVREENCCSLVIGTEVYEGFQIFSPVKGERQGSIVKLYCKKGASKLEGWFRGFFIKADRWAAR